MKLQKYGMRYRKVKDILIHKNCVGTGGEVFQPSRHLVGLSMAKAYRMGKTQNLLEFRPTTILINYKMQLKYIRKIKLEY